MLGLWLSSLLRCVVYCYSVLDVETQVEMSEPSRKSRHGREMVEEDTQTEPSVIPRSSKNKSHDVKRRSLSDDDDDDDVTKRKHHHHSKTDKHRHKHDQETESPSRKNMLQNFVLTESCETSNLTWLSDRRGIQRHS